ncbi:MAG: flagellar hook-length control protein FliK [Lachnospiraceae bacterium]|nr:flagellar hook-length control protein FliK [Lachnospiraceae bacterium]
MTSNQVSNSQIAGMLGFMNSPQLTGKTESSDFSSVFADSAKKLSADASDTSNKYNSDERTKADSEERTEKSNIAEEKSDKSEKIGKEKNTKNSDKKVSETNVTSERKPIEKEIESLKEVIEEIKSALMDAFDVTEEEFADALEILGMDQMALLMPENLQNISIELSDAESSISIVTDADLYEKVSGLMEKAENLLTQFAAENDIPVEDIKNAVRMPENIAENVIRNVKTEEGVVKTEEDDTFEENLVGKTVLVGERVGEISNQPSSNAKTNSDSSEMSEGVDEEIPAENVDASVKTTVISFAENLVEKTREILNADNDVSAYSSEQAEMILNQITERIKVELSPENTEINLKLHPETLGNVSVRVSQNSEGVLTAQFNAQNESVKAIIESQAIVLKESLEAKGVTVSAIEVMVGSHEFERNLSDNGKQQGEQQPKRNGVRRINLGTPEDETEIDDEDIIHKEIMKQNGNTIDYTA